MAETKKQTKTQYILTDEDIKALNDFGAEHTKKAIETNKQKQLELIKSFERENVKYKNVEDFIKKNTDDKGDKSKDLKAYEKKFAGKQVKDVDLKLTQLTEVIKQRVPKEQSFKSITTAMINEILNQQRDVKLDFYYVGKKLYSKQYKYTEIQKKPKAKQLAYIKDVEIQCKYFDYIDGQTPYPKAEDVKNKLDKLQNMSIQQVADLLETQPIFDKGKDGKDKIRLENDIDKGPKKYLFYSKGKQAPTLTYTGYVDNVVDVLKNMRKLNYSQDEIRNLIRQSVPFYDVYPQFINQSVMDKIIGGCKKFLVPDSAGYKRIQTIILKKDENGKTGIAGIQNIDSGSDDDDDNEEEEKDLSVKSKKNEAPSTLQKPMKQSTNKLEQVEEVKKDSKPQKKDTKIKLTESVKEPLKEPLKESLKEVKKKETKKETKKAGKIIQQSDSEEVDKELE